MVRAKRAQLLVHISYIEGKACPLLYTLLSVGVCLQVELAGRGGVAEL